jgi:hypothetical protein
MAARTLKAIIDDQDKQSSAIIKKQLNCEGWQVNVNDIPWMYDWPQQVKQFGRARRVYEKLLRLSRL